ncbi:MAG: MotA/TolQ/ExbB proton channel family protein [Myxococcales bacterium]|nr:MotA/TolQ/ExbB proton channel family protein [Myxococcales bacterium]
MTVPTAAADYRRAVLEFLNSWVMVAASCVLIAAVFALGLNQLATTLAVVKERNDQIHRELDARGPLALLVTAPEPEADHGDPQPRGRSGRLARLVRDQLRDLRNETRPDMRRRKLREWQHDARRLEASLAFWVDLLRQLGLLGTVLGLGLSLLVGQGDVRELLRPLGLAVWTTIVGLLFSIFLSWRYGQDIEIEADECDKNIEALAQHVEAPAVAAAAPA